MHKLLASHVFYGAPFQTCLGFIHQARFNGLLLLVVLAVAVSVTVFALSKPK